MHPADLADLLMMNDTIYRIDLGARRILEFRGPDALRFLNGQLTQDVALAVGKQVSVPSCVTDAKGRLQFRVWITALSSDRFDLDAAMDADGSLEARLTRYLIADDVEVTERSDDWRLIHFTADPGSTPKGIEMRRSSRFGLPGVDWWIPRELEVDIASIGVALDGDDLEDFRIRRMIPVEGRELIDGTLPPEAGLDASDISYTKGCYTGQEVISRIKSIGKVNHRLALMMLSACIDPASMELLDASGRSAGRITSLSPRIHDGIRHALGYLKRGAEGELMIRDKHGEPHALRLSGEPL